jgi:5'-deoxynucleotidase YfbR-like HD superfamily hydrolase
MTNFWINPKDTDLGCINTISGRRINLLNPDPKSIDIEDIAHSLAMQCRWTGHVNQFYSVAQHSVLSVEYWVFDCVGKDQRTNCLELLLHDAQEAYLHDISSPLKKLLPEYQRIEQNFKNAIAERFGLEQGPQVEEIISKVDRIMAEMEHKELREKSKLHRGKQTDLGRLIHSAGLPPISSWKHSFTERRFLHLFKTYKK